MKTRYAGWLGSKRRRLPAALHCVSAELSLKPEIMARVARYAADVAARRRIAFIPRDVTLCGELEQRA